MELSIGLIKITFLYMKLKGKEFVTVAEQSVYYFSEAYINPKKELPPFLQAEKPVEMRRQVSVPKELRCPLCGDLVRDAVVIPCCGMSYCDECKDFIASKHSILNPYR